MQHNPRQKLSVLVPVYNEQESIAQVVSECLEATKSANLDVEIVIIDNCSTDKTEKIVHEIATHDPRVKYIRFSRNFGPTVESSLAAGYRYCSGDAAIVIYSDLQDPPELIPEFVNLWRAGNDVVYGVQVQRKGEALWRRIAVKSFYRIMETSTDSPSLPNSGDFRLISRRVIDELNRMPERARFSRGLIAWLGFTSARVPYVRRPRISGKSKANVLAITRTAFTAITSFSLKPLRFLTGFGFLITFASALLMVWLALVALIGHPQPGLTTIACLSLLTLGLNMGALGLIGEYVGRIQLEVKQRPLYVIERTTNL